MLQAAPLQRRFWRPEEARRAFRSDIALLLVVSFLAFGPQPILALQMNGIRQARADTSQGIIARRLVNEGVLAEDDAVASPNTAEDIIAPAISDDVLKGDAVHLRVRSDLRSDVHTATTTEAESQEQSRQEGPLPSPTSALHPNTPILPPLNPDIQFSMESSSKPFKQYSESFPQYGKDEPGQHYRIEGNRLLSQIGNRERDSVLIVCVFNDAESWGANRSLMDFFDLVESFEYPTDKISITLLTSSMSEFSKAKHFFRRNINRFTRLSVIFRNDFSQDGLTRENRHADALQGNRRRMLARYRNYALLSTLKTWHQHVLWLDADVDVIPAGLLLKMTQSGLDILEPMCVRKYNNESDDWYNYDLNAWVGHRKVRPTNSSNDFVPGPFSAKSLYDLRDEENPIVPLDSVGGTMLYVRADVHRQGVLFPAHYVIGSEWGAEGYDGIETEGLCYSAHFLGYKCWGMPNDIIFHAT